MKRENTISSISNWFTQAVPVPTDKNRAVQLGVHFEEVAEMLTSLNYLHCAEGLNALADSMKGPFPPLSPVSPIDKKELLDALCDQIVTAVGVAHMHGMDIIGALREVDASNWSKFDENGKPIFNEQGKIAKGPSYFKPKLDPFV